MSLHISHITLDNYHSTTLRPVLGNKVTKVTRYIILFEVFPSYENVMKIIIFLKLFQCYNALPFQRSEILFKN